MESSTRPLDAIARDAQHPCESNPAAAATDDPFQNRPSKRRKTATATSASDRPCDICRRRKLRCVREPANEKCFLCAFNQQPCTFVEQPQRRKRPRRLVDAAPPAGTSTVGLSAGFEVDRPPAAAAATATATMDERHGDATSEHTVMVNFRARTTTTSAAAAAVAAAATSPPAPESPASLLNRTLGLHKTTHSVYIGPSSLQEPRLLGRQDTASFPPGKQSIRYRRMDPSTVFISSPDQLPGEEESVLDAIESLVRPSGPALVSLYFRIVHPSYPILHKGVWLEKYRRSYREFSPPLLAAVYALATDWWEYDPALASLDKPPVDRLVATATQALTAAMGRPKLSAVQAGLLLLQRSGGDSWVLTSQMVALSEEVGLHVDCSSWDIPDWEKGVRRRLAWAVLMQDRWGALIHGRPSHVSASHWRAPPLELGDFPESAADEDDAEGSAEVENGRYLFMRLARLTEIMSEAHAALYAPCRAAPGGGGGVGGDDDDDDDAVLALLELVKPTALKLKDWASTLPAELRMDDVRARKLCANGYLHLSYYATEIMIHRRVIRSLTPDHADHIRAICRNAAKTRLEHATAFVEKLRPEHLQSFWWFAAPKCLALIGVFAALLSATAPDPAEAAFFKRRLDDFHWTLKVRSKGSVSMAAAVREMEASLVGLGA
ncbi:hypothetical protein PpBr36_00196 [Pyricularia pennisetigena]|uniref:hypothetical protein n=1 Tax=Pyricularia pennisetigena TaxID=1578925 RepID=UPI001153B8A2|nr:hypothetical protein PpBr36_00196 [Pyricularia pennisetigena]TLS28362.1 hypothetical protein PpBr36_00196 [Pyricularia pennisetigena]